MKVALRIACALIAARACLAVEQIPIYEHPGRHHFKISTHSAEAQRLFNRGITLVYGYEGIRGQKEFLAAAAADPKCAMAWWGVALANGPNINGDCSAV